MIHLKTIMMLQLIFAAFAYTGTSWAQSILPPRVDERLEPAPELQLSSAVEQSVGVPNGDITRGASYYATYCAACHGLRGDGDGPLAEMLEPRPARHSDATFMNARSDAYLFRLLKYGGPAVGKSTLMAVWGRTLSDQQIRDLVAYLRSLAE